MHLTSREAQILRILLNKPQTLNHLSKQFNVSTKTLNNDISSINIKLHKFDTSLSIVDNVVNFHSIYSNVHWLNILSLNIAIEEEDMMILKLLCKNDYILLIDLAQELYMSKSKLEKMLACSQILKEYIVKKRNLGVKVELDIVNKLNICISILLPYVDDLNYLVTARSIVQQLIDEKIKIKEFKKDIGYFNLYIERMEHISDNECKILILFILLSKHAFQLEDMQMDKLVKNFINPNDSNKKTYQVIETEIVNILNNNNIEIRSKQILSALINHIYHTSKNSTVNTIDNEVELRIKTEYSYAYNIATEIYLRMNRVLSVNMPLYEQNYLAIYVQSLLNNVPYQQKLNILIVCQYGLSVSNYIQVWLERNLEFTCQYTISSILNFWQLDNKLDQFDLIITTVNNLEVNKQKIIQLKTVPLEDEMQELKRNITRFHFQKEADEFFTHINLIHASIDEIDNIYSSIETELHGNCTQFIELMKQRTEQGLTNVNGVIIMHSNGDLLTENHLLIYKLDKPIKYNNQKVKMIFVFAFTQEFLELYNHVIKQIYRVIYSSNFVSALCETSTTNQFMWIFKSQIKGRNYDN